MRVEVRTWDNGLAPRIPKPFAEAAGVAEGADVDVSPARGLLIAAPVASRAPRLRDLLRRVTRRNLHGEIGTGLPAGRESRAGDH